MKPQVTTEDIESGKTKLLKDRAGTIYSRGAVGKNDGVGPMIRRTPKAVEIKRAERKAKKEQNNT